MYREDKLFVEAIKLATGGVQYRGLAVSKTLVNAIKHLQGYYNGSRDIRYLEVALLYIQAYLEMGFDYDNAKEVFDRVLSEVGTTREAKFPKRFYVSRQVKINKTQVRSMIHRWPASPYQKLKINDVVIDIIDKVKNKKYGIFYYQCAVTQDMYELVINEKEIFFHDLRKGIFYSFIE